MIIDLVNTTTGKIEEALTAIRHRVGGPTSGKVLTLVIVTDEVGQYDALRFSAEASRDSPSRILAVIRRGGEEPRLDAEVHAGDTGPGETVLMRMYGPLAQHAESAVLPLLLPDTPVITWWPGEAPSRPADEPLGDLAQRRVTDVTGNADPLDALTRLAPAYRPGDTDLSWTRLTPWRSLLAAGLDKPHNEITAISVEAATGNPSAVLLASWLSARLVVPAEVGWSSGPGVTSVALETTGGRLSVTRPDGRVATLSRPGQPQRQVGLHRRPKAELIAEELRRLEPDEVYREALVGWPENVAFRVPAGVP
jgi:glucose-6-phosphate dehydrogenase assembly protein OpcA